MTSTWETRTDRQRIYFGSLHQPRPFPAAPVIHKQCERCVTETAATYLLVSRKPGSAVTIDRIPLCLECARAWTDQNEGSLHQTRGKLTWSLNRL